MGSPGGLSLPYAGVFVLLSVANLRVGVDVEWLEGGYNAMLVWFVHRGVRIGLFIFSGTISTGFSVERLLRFDL